MKRWLIPGRMLQQIGWCITACVLSSAGLHAAELTISQVQPDRVQANPDKREVVSIRFRLTATARVALQLFDGRELLIREIQSTAALAPGEHTLEWDLNDHAGRQVPPEAYTYVLEAYAADGTMVRYDVADQTGGGVVTPRDVQWDATSGRLTYGLDKPSRVNIRMGLNNGGPLLRTLIDWVARSAGAQSEPWDGKDASGVLDLAQHPRLALGVQAFSLPANSILVGVPQANVALIDRLPKQRVVRVNATNQPKRMYSHAQQPMEGRGDFNLQLTLPRGLPRSSAGLPIIADATPVRLDIADADRQRALARRFEPVFFLDGQFVFENETGFVPMTWNFDPATLNDGEHFITVNQQFPEDSQTQ